MEVNFVRSAHDTGVRCHCKMAGQLTGLALTDGDDLSIGFQSAAGQQLADTLPVFNEPASQLFWKEIADQDTRGKGIRSLRDVPPQNHTTAYNAIPDVDVDIWIAALAANFYVAEDVHIDGLGEIGIEDSRNDAIGDEQDP